MLPIADRFQGGWIERWTPDSTRILVHAGVCLTHCTPPIPDAFLSIPTDGGASRRVRPGGSWYRWVADGQRLELRHWWEPREVAIRVPPAVDLVGTSGNDERAFWALGDRRGQRVLVRYVRPWDDPDQQPRVTEGPAELSWVEGVQRGWVSVTGRAPSGVDRAMDSWILPDAPSIGSAAVARLRWSYRRRATTS